MAKAAGSKSGARGGTAAAQSNMATTSQCQAAEAANTGPWNQENLESAEASSRRGAGSTTTGSRAGKEAEPNKEAKEDLFCTGRLRKPSAKAKAAAKEAAAKAANNDNKEQVFKREDTRTEQQTPRRRRGRSRKKSGGGGDGLQRQSGPGQGSTAGAGDGGGDDNKNGNNNDDSNNK